jgi:uncharacterized protein (TIGR03066 family)
MFVLRLALVGCFMLGVATAGAAQKEKSKIDKAKLIGVWTFVKTDSKDAPPPGVNITVEFTKDGKLLMTYKFKDKTVKETRTYSVKGDQLTVTGKEGDKEKTETETITELTDKKLVTVEKKGGKSFTTEFKK